MALTRRNTLIGLGTLAGGFGLISATGAFDTVAADRQFEVELDDDADALLELQVLDEEYVEDDDGVIAIDIGTGDDAGLNQNAITTFEGLFSVGNNGTEDVQVSIDAPDGVEFEDAEGESLTGDDGVTVDEGQTGDDALEVTLKVDTRDGGENEFGGAYTEPEGDEVYNITISANAEA